jgi:hypothetical protein
MLATDLDFMIRPNNNCSLWRYMDLTKLLAMLESRQLWFPRADKFEDPYEGALSKSWVSYLREQTKTPVNGLMWVNRFCR